MNHASEHGELIQLELMLAGVAHEVRGPPIGGIALFSRLLEEGLKAGAPPRPTSTWHASSTR